MRFSKEIPKSAGEQEAEQRSSSAVGTAGVLLLDSALSPMYVNDEAVRILAYPGHQKDGPCLKEFLARVIRSLDLTPRGVLEKYSIIGFMSGRRHYTGRLFCVSQCARNPHQPMVALLIERTPASANFLEMAGEFNLTQRECEAVQHLALGLTSKEIAARMGISPNTVKAFLRLVMIKTGVTTRSGIIGKLLKRA